MFAAYEAGTKSPTLKTQNGTIAVLGLSLLVRQQYRYTLVGNFEHISKLQKSQ